ncbi:YcaO-like family protein [Variovorax terrae]|uniref:YcaO-like family protein n=1 Tax=Variovorax terrae TaxID=2923278 RepID=A0A9X1VWD2_9BURK|nr:YcaO-like family protein [Variovorax terrae]MCJ0764499.1 YcaO-like family protein [Variovorax terrae]
MPPTVELLCTDVLEQAAFKLVEAKIDWTSNVQSSGWGRDRDFETAKWKAINEAVERLCYTRLPRSIYSSATELERYVEPAMFVRYLPRQYAMPDFKFAPFDALEPRHWVCAKRVRSDATNHILADFVCSPRAFDATYRRRLTTNASTSGCASSGSIDVAIMHATLELIERDAFMRHWFSQTSGYHISIPTLPQQFRSRINRLHEAGCRAGVQWLYMGTHPTWLAWAQHPTLFFTSIGSASGLNGELALETALNELETMALVRLEGVPEQSIQPSEVRGPADHAAIYSTKNYFQKADALWYGEAPQRSFSDAAAAFETNSDALYQRLESAGHQLYWVDLTIPETRGILDGRTIYTVRVLSTHLIPMAFGYGRLPLGMDTWFRVNTPEIHPFA